MNNLKCGLCGIKRPAGALYVVTPLAGGPHLICWWCVKGVKEAVKESSEYKREGEIDTRAYSDKFINEEQAQAKHGPNWIAILKGGSKQ